MDAMPEVIVRQTAATFVHPTAIVARGAELGIGVHVGPYCSVGADVVIEDRAELVSVPTSYCIRSARSASRRRI